MYDYDRADRVVAADVGLWRFDENRGAWTLERRCESESGNRWLEVFQKDEPDVQFQLSVKKPSRPPAGSGSQRTRSRRPRLMRLKYTDEEVRRMLERQDFSLEIAEALMEAAKERGLHVTSVSSQSEVKAELRKHFKGKTAASAVDAKKFDRYIQLAADDIEKLRKSDVFRVLSEAKSAKELSALVAYITGKRSDLKSTLAEDAEELMGEKGW